MRRLALEEDDVAIILKSDGSCEASVPTLKDDQNKVLSDNLFLGAAVMNALQNEYLCTAIQKALYEVCKSSEKKQNFRRKKKAR